MDDIKNNGIYQVPVENPNTDFNNSNATSNQAYISNEDLIAKLTSETSVMSNNLKNQREIINNYANEKKSLQAENEKLAARIKELEEANTNIQADDRLAKMEEELAVLQQQSAEYAQRDRDAKLLPIIEAMQQSGIKKENVSHVFKQIRDQYGVDLISNPNLETAKLFLTQMTTFEGSTQIPQGASTNNTASASYEQQRYEAAVKDYRANRKQDLQNAINQFNMTGKIPK